MIMVLILSLSNLFIAIFMTELTLHLVIQEINNQAYHKDQLTDLFFLTFIYVTYSLTL